jgi:predicted nucleotidyltransferase component of viral defense system
MIGKILSDRVRELRPANAIEQEHQLQELLQHYMLASLWRARFFRDAMFHGGTCLRILFGTRRFSEHLDFLLKSPDPTFRWRPYLTSIARDGEAEGITLEVQEKDPARSTVRSAFVKTTSLGQLLMNQLPFPRRAGQKLRVKLEIDANPPGGSSFETRFITFPVTAAITTQTLGSGFSTKLHALLCRPYVKGRDWYDLLWYLSRSVVPEPVLLSNALHQQGPWAGQAVPVTATWLIETMSQRINEIDWQTARDDVRRFVPAAELDSIDLWGPELFLSQLDRLEELLVDQVAWKG